MKRNIEAERGRNGLSKTELAKLLEISLPTYNGYINEASIPSAKLVLLADLFGVSCDYLLGRTSDPHNSKEVL